MKRESLARANARIRRLIAETHAEVDAHHARPDLQHPGVTCRPGCASAAKGCCSTLVIALHFEADYIVARHLELVRSKRAALAEQSRRIDEAIGGELFSAMFDDAAAEREASRRYHALDMPCVFLGPGNRCEIYSSRPLPCRTHFVLSPPHECEASGVNENHITLDKGSRSTAPARLMRRIANARRADGRYAVGGDLTAGMLPQLVLRALELAETGRPGDWSTR